jgi:hypothetical protein
MSGLRGRRGADPKPERPARHNTGRPEHGEGFDLAVSGTQTTIQCASSLFRKSRQTNFEGTKRLLEAAAKSDVSHFVYSLFRHRLRFILIEITGQRKRTLVLQLPGKTGRAFRGGR